jgi:hypothetical protein
MYNLVRFKLGSIDEGQKASISEATLDTSVPSTECRYQSAYKYTTLLIPRPSSKRRQTNSRNDGLA